MHPRTPILSDERPLRTCRPPSPTKQSWAEFGDEGSDKANQSAANTDQFWQKEVSKTQGPAVAAWTQVVICALSRQGGTLDTQILRSLPLQALSSPPTSCHLPSARPCPSFSGIETRHGLSWHNTSNSFIVGYVLG